MRILSVAIVLSVALWHFLISPAPAVSAMPVAVSTADNGQPMNLGALARRPTTDEQHTAQPQTKELRFSAAVKIDNTVERVLVSHTETQGTVSLSQVLRLNVPSFRSTSWPKGSARRMSSYLPSRSILQNVGSTQGVVLPKSRIPRRRRLLALTRAKPTLSGASEAT